MSLRNMDIEEYINSGVLHDYCINTLSAAKRLEVEQVCAEYPEIKRELLQMQQALEKFAEGAAKWPGAQIKEEIWGTLENLNKEKAGDLNDLPLINKYSDYNRWKKIVMPLMPKEIPDEPVITPIRNSGGVMQLLMIGRTGVPDETHENERESFLVLEGECECHIGDNVYRLGPGGFIEIPMYEHHNVKVLSEYVVAIMQQVAV